MRVLLLVEGQTEERFAKSVLIPHFEPMGIYVSPTVIETKRIFSGGSFRGGVCSFRQFRSHLVRLLGSARNPAEALVTTMLDYYALPSDFPGLDQRPAGGADARVQWVERAIHGHFGAPANFLPYLSVHEFEALLFAAADAVPAVMGHPEMSPLMRAVVEQCGDPEKINERPDCSPSCRLRQMFAGYNKALHGVLASQRIPLDMTRRACPHFHWWISEIEARATA